MFEWMKRKAPKWLYLESAPGSGFYKRRGPLNRKSDPEGFARMMANGNLKVIVTDRDEGALFQPGEEAEQALVLSV